MGISDAHMDATLYDALPRMFLVCAPDETSLASYLSHLLHADSARQPDTKVLVHCMTGTSRCDMLD